jgi:hypothetical protein
MQSVCELEWSVGAATGARDALSARMRKGRADAQGEVIDMTRMPRGPIN